MDEAPVAQAMGNGLHLRREARHLGRQKLLRIVERK